MTSYKKISFVNDDNELTVSVSEDNASLTISISDMYSHHHYQEVKLDYYTVQELISELISKKEEIEK
jgi:hypothetical protein